MVTARPALRLAAWVAIVTAVPMVALLPAQPGFGVVAFAAEDDTSASCATVFPDVVWEFEHQVSGITMSTAGLNEATSGRFADDVEIASAMMIGDGLVLGSPSVCLFAGDIPRDAEGLVPDGQRLHAVAWLPDQVVAVSASNLRLVRKAVTFGLSQVVLWHSSDGDGFVEPLSSAISQWYVSRIEGTLALRHSEVRRVNFFEPITGIDWTAATQEPVVAWNPQFQDSAQGDIVDFAVGRHGTGVLLDPDPVRWRTIEGDWSVALRAEIVGEDFRTTGWILGLAVFLGVIGLAVILGLQARRVKRSRLRATERRRPSASAS